jgi:hypothetical protein
MRNILASNTTPNAASAAMAARSNGIAPDNAADAEGFKHDAPKPAERAANGLPSLLGSRMQPRGVRKSLFRC